MADDSIPSGSSFTLSLPLTGGTNIDFINDAGNTGELILLPAAFNISTATNAGTVSITTVTIGGEIENFQPGDQIDLQNIDVLFADLDVSTTASSANTTFDNDVKFAAESEVQFFIAPSGTVTASVNSPLTKIDANTQLIYDEIRSGVFGTAANNAILTIQPFLRGTVVDELITVNTPVNPCFALGTRILTVRGEISVEDLAVGDALITYTGVEQKIIWIGQRRLEIPRHAQPQTVRPVIIEAGALADCVPARRLVVSPDHAFYLDRVLVQAKDLLNGVTIREDMNAKAVQYYHVELAAHDIIFAESAAVESYLDTGHRGVFDNAAAPLLLHPDLMQIRRERQGCAPLCRAGEILAAIRTRLAQRCYGVRGAR